MAVWTKEGYNERRALMLSQYAVGMAPLRAVEPLDEDDKRFVASVQKAHKDAKKSGMSGAFVDIVYD